MAAAEWIKERLPSKAKFNKHGVAKTVDQAIAAALADNSNDKYLALADLLEALAANQEYRKETMDDYSYEDPLLKERADYWRSVGVGGGEAPGGFTYVPATFRPTSATDEYSH